MTAFPRFRLLIAWLLVVSATHSADNVAASANSMTASDSRASSNAPEIRQVRLADIRLRDSCVWVDEANRLYYLVSAGRRGPHGRATVVAYTSKDLITWEGPRVIFEIPENWWSNRGIWAPELQQYRGKFYLYLTFDSDHKFPEQWRDWLPRVKRGSQILVGESPLGPFKPFANRSTLPEDMMTLDGTVFEEDGVPYMVFCHEWVQIKDGTVEYVQLKEDLAEIVGEPKRLFHGSDAPWAKKHDQYGCYITDAPWFYRTQRGTLLMLWSSVTANGYAVGIARSTSGKLAGPWEHEAKPIFDEDGGHPMLFRRLDDGQLMMILHQPNQPPNERARLFEMEEVDDTLRVKAPFPQKI